MAGVARHCFTTVPALHIVLMSSHLTKKPLEIKNCDKVREKKLPRHHTHLSIRQTNIQDNAHVIAICSDSQLGITSIHNAASRHIWHRITQKLHIFIQCSAVVGIICTLWSGWRDNTIAVYTINPAKKGCC